MHCMRCPYRMHAFLLRQTNTMLCAVGDGPLEMTPARVPVSLFLLLLTSCRPSLLRHPPTAPALRYNGTVTDPCKATSLASPEHLDTGLLTARRAPQPGPRDTFSPEMWAKAEATPYGRYSHQNPRTYQRRTCPTHGEEAPNPVPDHYTVLSHKALKEVSKKENGLGKSVTGPMPSTVIQHGSGKKPVTGPPSQLHSL